MKEKEQPKNAPKILHLTLKKEAFEVMVTGEKPYEIRSFKTWIRERLIEKNGKPKKYDLVKFVNGYGHDRPFFYAEYKGSETVKGMDVTFSNGFVLHFIDKRYRINLGNVVTKGNMP